MNCSVARTLEIVGEWWTPLILRDAFLGLSRFEELQSSLGIARNVLTKRLTTLVQAGIMERQRYQEHPERFECLLTEAGRALFPIVVSLLEWGDRWTAGEAGPPPLLIHEPCGQAVDAVLTCSWCGEEVRLDNVQPEPGPGAG